jgi:serine/threonine-protein kinase
VGPDDTNAPVREGDVVAGKYRVERTIGSGGMGFVVAARHLTLGEPVALKFLLAHQSSNRETVERLMREARATFRLRSAHSVRVHDVGELPAGNLYIVMELLEGRDLRAELSARGPLPPGDVVAYAVDACDALHEAHALGIVHRDLKPGNLFLTTSAHGRAMVKVLDFGMSKLDPALYEGEGGPLTLPETALGTPRYMAPEQWQSAANVDLTADIWALGVVMYELLTGKPPLHKMQLAERQTRLLAGAIPSPREARPDIPGELERVVMHCLRADPRARWGSAAHLARALRKAVPPSVAEVVEITRTGVTAVVPPEERARQAALAFEQAPRSAPLPETRRETPEARGTAGPVSSEPPAAVAEGPSPRSEDFETTTEVRAPMFTPADGVAVSAEEVVSSPAPQRMSKTLRSYEGDAPGAATGETTLRLAGAPPHPAAAEPTRTTVPLPPAPAPVAPVPPPARLAPPPPPRRSMTAYVVLAGVAALLVAALVAWLAVRAR